MVTADFRLMLADRLEALEERKRQRESDKLLKEQTTIRPLTNA